MAKGKKTTGKNGKINIRVEDEIRDDLDASHDRHNTNDTDVVTELVRAYLVEVKREDAVRKPFTVRIAARVVAIGGEREGQKVAEDAAGFGSGRDMGMQHLQSREREESPSKTSGQKAKP